ncbi:MAG: nucleotide sugar dehydrogenase [Candidatus Gerdarchaeota archaeon]|nr:MAG: nucleotide sugar dehydrogenase [Candidatus Gerdarchaeota archaeon]RLI72519.1 MAG: nucleotide sugar dehydrogenase [Candidatus Gerdarchaeota archaeon]
MKEKTKIAVIGMGYVGIPAAALLADVDGFEVIGIQRRSKRSGWKIEALNRGECPILNEPELPELIRRVVLEKKTFRVTDDTEVLRDMNYILIDVQTPTDKETHQPLYKSLREVSAVVGQKMKDGAVVIVESTVAPGTTENIVKPILEENSGKTCGKDFYLVFAYERVMVGRLINNIVNYPRVIGGVTEECTKKGLWLYKHIVKEKLIPVSATTAEVAKVVENTYRDVQIAFANEVALACEALHVDFNDVRKCVNSLPFNSNAYRDLHLPGAGVGGHCLPKDPWLLKFGVDTYGKIKVPFEVIVKARMRNDQMPLHMLELAEAAAKKAGIDIKNAKLAILGASFLENSEDTRNSPTEAFVKLLEERKIKWAIHDPYVRQREFPYPLSKNLEEIIRDADILLIFVKHKDYYALEPQWLKERMKHPIIIDGRDVINLEKFRKNGFVAFGVGKPNY